MGLQRVGWDGKQYHAWIFTDEPRPHYLYDEDADGAFCIRNSDNVNVDTECEYIQTHSRSRRRDRTARSTSMVPGPMTASTIGLR